MTIEDIKRLIALGESETLEFKKSTSLLSRAFETICAFLNGKGGTVLLGINDSGKIIGQHISDATQREIARELSKIEPRVAIDIDITSLLSDPSKKIITITAPNSKHSPHTYDSRPFQRTQSSTERMSQHRYEQLIITRGQLNHNWDQQITNSSLLDLDNEEIFRTVSAAVRANRLTAQAQTETIEEILTRLHLLKNGKLTNAALVLFSKKTHSTLPHCSIKLARFRGTNKIHGFIDSQIASGHAFQIMKAADHFIMRHLSVESFLNKDSMIRVDSLPIPVLAVREALSNAICHRDYENQNTPITLAIFDDRMEIWNYGTLPPPLTLKDLSRSHQSLPRNATIAHIFYLRHYVESWGTGTNQMINLCLEAGIPKPIFSENSGGMMVTFDFGRVLSNTSLNISKQLSPIQRRQIIFETLQSANLSSSEVHLKFQQSTSLRTIKNDLSEMQKLGKIESIGQGRSTKWKVK